MTEKLDLSNYYIQKRKYNHYKLSCKDFDRLQELIASYDNAINPLPYNKLLKKVTCNKTLSWQTLYTVTSNPTKPFRRTTALKITELLGISLSDLEPITKRITTQSKKPIKE